MKKAIVRLFVCLLCTCLLCVSVPCPDVHAADAPQKPQANDEVRHTVCHALSAQAQAYYADTTAYSALCALPGAAAGEDSAAAMQNNALFDALHALIAQSVPVCDMADVREHRWLRLRKARISFIEKTALQRCFPCEMSTKIPPIIR